jgi:hypothetical protein
LLHLSPSQGFPSFSNLLLPWSPSTISARSFPSVWKQLYQVPSLKKKVTSLELISPTTQHFLFLLSSEKLEWVA